VNLLRKEPLTSEQEEQRKEKSELRTVRLKRVQEARAATRGMQSPEPLRGVIVAVALAGAAIFSFLGHDVQQKTTTIKGKSSVAYVALPPHPAEAIILLVLAVAAGTTIYWRRRLVTGVAFMVSAALGLGTPFPKAAQDLQYAVFLLPAVYVLWMLIFRMNKEQKELLAKMAPAAGGGTTTRNASRRNAGGRASTASTSRRAKVQTTSATGRPLPPRSGRYTPPRAKPTRAKPTPAAPATPAAQQRKG
jgi:hypothetical protein